MKPQGAPLITGLNRFPAFFLLGIVYKTFDQTEVVRVETGAWALEWK